MARSKVLSERQAHARARARVRKMSSAEQRKTLVDAGIYTKGGQLTERYGGPRRRRRVAPEHRPVSFGALQAIERRYNPYVSPTYREDFRVSWLAAPVERLADLERLDVSEKPMRLTIYVLKRRMVYELDKFSTEPINPPSVIQANTKISGSGRWRAVARG